MRMDEPASRGWLVKALLGGGCAVAVVYLLGLFLSAMFVPLRMLGQSTMCQTNMIIMTRAFRLYSDDYDQRYTPAPGWMDRLFPYVQQERRYHCPAVSQPRDTRYGYAMNETLAGKERRTVADPNSAPIVYDSTDLAKSAFDKFASLPRPGRHMLKARKETTPPRRGNFVGYAEGNVRFKVDKP